MTSETTGMSMPHTPGLVEIEDLTKTYGDFFAVKHLSLSVAGGQIFALLGPNGAGQDNNHPNADGDIGSQFRFRQD